MLTHAPSGREGMVALADGGRRPQDPWTETGAGGPFCVAP